jgi:hypothetical protein
VRGQNDRPGHLTDPVTKTIKHGHSPRLTISDSSDTNVDEVPQGVCQSPSVAISTWSMETLVSQLRTSEFRCAIEILAPLGTQSLNNPPPRADSIAIASY